MTQMTQMKSGFYLRLSAANNLSTAEVTTRVLYVSKYLLRFSVNGYLSGQEYGYLLMPWKGSGPT